MTNNKHCTETNLNTSNVTTMGTHLRLSRMKRSTIVKNVNSRCVNNVDLTSFMQIRIALQKMLPDSLQKH